MVGLLAATNRLKTPDWTFAVANHRRNGLFHLVRRRGDVLMISNVFGAITLVARALRAVSKIEFRVRIAVLAASPALKSRLCFGRFDGTLARLIGALSLLLADEIPQISAKEYQEVTH